MTQHPPLMDALERSGHRVTEPRTLVADLIADQGGHFTAADLLDRASHRRLRLGRATVFRALELFTELGALERIDLPSGEHAYVICEPAEHHHHVVCSRCGRSTEVADAGLQDVVDDIGRRTGYQIESHRLELFGLCADCHRSTT